MPHNFSDLHCHPGARPWYNSTGSMWETYFHRKNGKPDLGRLKKVVKKQLQGKRGGLYDQSGFPKLVNGGVKIVFAALYPIEKGFLLKKPFRVRDPQSGKWINTPKPGVRSFIVSASSKYPADRIKEMAFEEYWDQVIEEYEGYRRESSNIKGDGPFPIQTGSKAEIEKILAEPDFGLQGLLNFDPAGAYTIMDGAHSPDNVLQGDHVLTVLTMEGIGMVTQKFHHANQNLPLAVRTLSDIQGKIRLIKQNTPVFFITFCHHMDNGVCGHARSMASITKITGATQTPRMNRGFTTVGKKMVEHLLSIRKDKNGTYELDPDAGRRIFIDMKHMSFAGRQTVIQMVEDYNANKPKKASKIPLIASHSAYSGFTELEMMENILTNGEAISPQTRQYHSSLLGLDVRFNTWSINLFQEEIQAIVRSEGLIGLSLEQNILGLKFGSKLKGRGKDKVDKTRKLHTQLIAAQLCIMAMASNSGHFWKCICIGSDYDGLIDPADGYPTVLTFEVLREQLISELTRIIGNEEAKRAIFYTSNDVNIQNVVDDFCFNNTRDFVTRHYSDQMPEVRNVSLSHQV